MRRSGPRHIEWREFSFSRRSPLSVRMLTTRILAAKETLTIMEFPRAFNEEPLPASNGAQIALAEPELLPAQRARRIIAGEKPTPFLRRGRGLQTDLPMPE